MSSLLICCLKTVQGPAKLVIKLVTKTGCHLCELNLASVIRIDLAGYSGQTLDILTSAYITCHCILTI